MSGGYESDNYYHSGNDASWGPPASQTYAEQDRPGPSTFKKTHTRSPTWISISTHGDTSHSQVHVPRTLPPPPRPLSIPSPAMNARGASELERQESSAEYMTVDPGEDFDEEQYDYQQKGGRGFVGGFMSGLKRLPRSMMKGSHDSRPVRRATETGENDIQTPLPQYESTPHIPGPSQIHYVEEEGPLEYEEEYEEVDPRQGPSHRTSAATTIHDVRTHDSRTHESYSFDPYAQDQRIHDGETTMVHHGIIPSEIQSPVLVEPRPASDYDKMSSPIPSPSDVSFGSHIFHIQQFFRFLYHLPWVSNRITADYYPGERHGYTRSRARTAPVSWYTRPQHQPVDLLGTSNYRPAQHRSPRMRDLNSAPDPRHYQSPPISDRGPVSPAGNEYPRYNRGYAPRTEPVYQDAVAGSSNGSSAPPLEMHQASRMYSAPGTPQHYSHSGPPTVERAYTPPDVQYNSAYPTPPHI